MRGQENISGTALRKYNVFGDSTPEAWMGGDGRMLEHMGLITINKRSYGYSVTKKPVPSKDDDPEGFADFEALLQEKLRLSVAEYAESLKVVEAKRTRLVRDEERTDALAPEPRGVKTELGVKAENSDDDCEVVEVASGAAASTEARAGARSTSSRSDARSVTTARQRASKRPLARGL